MGATYLFLLVYALVFAVNNVSCQTLGNVESSNIQNGTFVPYPYRTILGLPTQRMGIAPPNMGVPPVGAMPPPYPINYGVLPVSMVPNDTRNLDYRAPNYAYLAQQGIPAYQYVVDPGMPNYYGYPQAGTGYYRYPPNGVGYPRNGFDPYAHIQTEIIDVSPEYQRQILGLADGGNQLTRTRPRYNVKVDSRSGNITSIPSNLTKPIITQKTYATSIRRHFVYDSSRPSDLKPINLHFVNGEQVFDETTVRREEVTTENEDVEATTNNITKQGRRYMDVPKSCPKGTLLAHNGECIAPFLATSLRNPLQNATKINENAIEISNDIETSTEGVAEAER